MSFALVRSDRRGHLLAGLAIVSLTAACSSCPVPPTLPAGATAPEPIPVVRQGRYTLVEILPTEAQQNLMQQIVDLTLPAAASTTVGDALQLVLSYSGYRLCADSPDTDALSALPIPGVHAALGPLTLRETLHVLAGSGWQLAVDEQAREVCFERQP